MIFIGIPYAVHLDSHIAVTQFVILVDKILLGGFVSLVGEFLCLEERIQFSRLVHL